MKSGARTVTARLADVVALSPLAVSVLVAVRVSVKSLASLAGGVTVRAESVQPVMSAVVLPAVAMKLWVPSLSVAPTGIAPTCRARVSEPSVSTSAEPTVSGIAVFSLPVTGAVLSVGASATGTP